MNIQLIRTILIPSLRFTSIAGGLPTKVSFPMTFSQISLMKTYPKVKSVVHDRDKKLLVTFDNGVIKVYDCKPLLKTEAFGRLKQDWLFKSVQADKSGYGISWDDEINLSESELWENGQLAGA